MDFDKILPCVWEEGLHFKNGSCKHQKWVNSFTPSLPLSSIHLFIEQVIPSQRLKVKKVTRKVYINPAWFQGEYREVNKLIQYNVVSRSRELGCAWGVRKISLMWGLMGKFPWPSWLGGKGRGRALPRVECAEAREKRIHRLQQQLVEENDWENR